MPVISVDFEDLISLIGKDVPRDELLEIVPMMGASLEGVEENEVSFEFFPNRPDLYSVEGLARAVRGFLGMESGLPQYPIEKSGITLGVEDSVLDVRPIVVGGLVKGVEMSDYLVRSLMDLQEKLHLTVGRDRRKVSIGVHDLDNVKPPFTYKAVPPDSVSFIPLASSERMNMKEILERHEKGIAYAFILEGKENYPVIVDSNDDVLSFPPIINGILTTVTEDTENLFLDVTGTDFDAVHHALVVVATSLAERGGSLESVTILRGGERIETPNLSPMRRTLSVDYVQSLIGTKLSLEEVCSLLRKMRFGCHPRTGKIEVDIPPYRNDVLHAIDLVEDVAIAYGYDRLHTELPKAMTFGELLPLNDLTENIRVLMVGYGYLEVTTLTLVAPDFQEGSQNVTHVKNPITREQSCLRTSLIPSLLSVLKANKHHELPQRIFEVGDVVTEGKNRRTLGAVTIHSRTGFTEAKSLAISMMRDFGRIVEVKSKSDPRFIPGRCASLLSDSEEIGYFGELSPALISEYGLKYPAIALEINVSSLL